MTGLFFGSFNPVHWGHLILANILRQRYGFKEILFIPSPMSPFKIPPSSPLNKKHKNYKEPKKQLLRLSHFTHRVKMLELALLEGEGCSVCDIEKTLPFPNYTYQTLRKLKKRSGFDRASLIMGEDNFILLPKWKEYNWIIRHFPICVYNRSFSSDAASEKGISSPLATPKLSPTLLLPKRTTPTPLLHFSSREIRSRIQHQQSIEHLVPKAVSSYLNAHPLLYTH